MSHQVFITGHINRKTALCHCLQKAEQIKGLEIEARQVKPYIGTSIHRFGER